MKPFIVAVALLACACSSEESPKEPDRQVNAVQATLPPNALPYEFDRPSRSFVLPDELVEISGLTVLPEGHLATIQDEDGIVYVLSPDSGAVEARLPFGEKGDYEGITWLGDRGYVLRSDGTVVELTGSISDMRQVATHETPLHRKNDAEGLGFDRVRGRLLIACKDDPGSGLGDDQRAIYSFDPVRGELSSEPAYVIDRKEVEKYLYRGETFKPSGIAVHPGSGDVYVLSALSQAIAVLAGEGGGLKAVQPLQKDVFEQPEGLAFLPNGTLYIASEGEVGPPMLYEFREGGSD